MKKLLLLVVLGMMVGVGCAEKNEPRSSFERKGRVPETPHGPDGKGVALPGAQTGFPGGGTTQPQPGTSPFPQPSPFGTPASNGSLGAWGVVKPVASQVTYNNQVYNASANDAVRWFMSTHFKPEAIGATTAEQDALNMSCQNPNRCGLLISFGNDGGGVRSPLQTQSGTISQAMQSGQKVGINGGNIAIGIYDSLVGQASQSGNTITAIPIYVALQPGVDLSYVQGSRVQLQFSDQFGGIVVSGTISGNTVYGDIDYVNTSSLFEGGQGVKGRLGSFQVGLCQMFRCQ